jgi:hypothetical protein
MANEQNNVAKALPSVRIAPVPSPLQKWWSFAWKVPVITVPIGAWCVILGYLYPFLGYPYGGPLLMFIGFLVGMWPTMGTIGALPGAIAQTRKCAHVVAIEWIGYLSIAIWPLFFIPLIWSLVGRKRIETPLKAVPDGWFVPGVR